MILRDLAPEQIASILHRGQLYEHHGDQFWFVVMRGHIEIRQEPNGDYVGERLHIHMKPQPSRQVAVAAGMSASSVALGLSQTAEPK